MLQDNQSIIYSQDLLQMFPTNNSSQLIKAIIVVGTCDGKWFYEKDDTRPIPVQIQPPQLQSIAGSWPNQNTQQANNQLSQTGQLLFESTLRQVVNSKVKNFPLLLKRRLDKLIANNLLPNIKNFQEICTKRRQTCYPKFSYTNQLKIEQKLVYFYSHFTQNSKETLSTLKFYFVGQSRHKLSQANQQSTVTKLKIKIFDKSESSAQLYQEDLERLRAIFRKQIINYSSVLLQYCSKSDFQKAENASAFQSYVKFFLTNLKQSKIIKFHL